MGYQGNWPKTKDEWWTLVDEHWADLLSLMHRFIGPKLGDVEKLKADRDSDLVISFNDAWFKAPEVPGLSEISGWDLLCDLCSEAYVLDG